jgi:hypothetical protein
VYYTGAHDDDISEFFLDLLRKVSFYINRVVVVDELHNFLEVWILIGIDDAFAFISFENYGIVANDFFFDLVQDFLCVVLFYILFATWYLIYSCLDVGS